MLDFVSGIDHSFTNFLRSVSPHNVVFDTFYSFLSFQGFTVLIWLIIGMFTVFLEERRNPGISHRDISFLIMFISSVLSANIITYLLKFLMHRHRPILTDLTILTNSCPSDFSFPSAHAATAFAAAAALAGFDRKHRIAYFLLAGLIAYSRIYLGCHYMADIIVGSVIGYFTTLFFRYFIVRQATIH